MFAREYNAKGACMEYLETTLWVIGFIVFLLILAGLQRKYSPETIVNGFMDLKKLNEICPMLCKKKDQDLEKK